MDAREFYRDVAMRIAADMHRTGRTGIPSHADVEATLAAKPVRRGSRQHQAAVAGREIKALPTKRVRRIKRRARKLSLRVIAGAAVAVQAGALLALMGFPAVVVITMGVALFVIAVGWRS